MHKGKGNCQLNYFWNQQKTGGEKIIHFSPPALF
jgi:hypothetical protein